MKKDFEKDYSTKFETELFKAYRDIETGFENQNDRDQDIEDYWDIYNNKLNSKQYYDGNSQIFVPITNNAVEARTTRFSNQIFPQNGRYVDCVTGDGSQQPYAHVALLENYVRKSHLKTMIPALITQGDIEGQYSLYVSWRKVTREVTYRVSKGIKVDGQEMKGVDDYDDIQEEDVEDSHPVIEILPDCDLLVLPVAADTIDEALECGGSVTIIKRLTKSKVKEYIKDKTFKKSAGDSLLSSFNKAGNRRNTRKELAKAAGIKAEGSSKYALIYESWSKIDGKIYVTYYGGPALILGCKRNPYWCDRVPVISCPVKKMGGVFKGVPPVSKCQQMQYAANDAANEGMDSAAYSLLPIVMTDPEKNPRVGSMVLNLAAIWETNPNDTQIIHFPALWKDAFEIISALKNEIFQTLSVNPAMIPNAGGKKKASQAEIANEQQVDILTTANAVTVLEEGILTPLMERYFEYDHQYRSEPITVRKYGEMGLRAEMEDVPPIQMTERYLFKWFGVEAARSAQQVQQQISAVNVVRGIPANMYEGYKLDMVPVIENVMENAFGPRLAPKVFKDMRSQLSIDPEKENTLLSQNFAMAVNPMDDDAEHMKVHGEALQQGDPHGTIRTHMMMHQMQIAAKSAAHQQQQGQQGVPGGAAPGVAGTPKPGSVPAGPSNMKKPPGSIHPDQMQGGGAMPRKF